jgi:DNA recombination protein RmuC
MEIYLLVLATGNLFAVLILGLWLTRRNSGKELGHIEHAIERAEERLTRQSPEQTAILRRDLTVEVQNLREELGRRLDILKDRLGDDAKSAREELRDIAELSRKSVEAQLTRLTADNGQRLEEIRRTVTEKLEGTLERRLGDSFRLVSERLEQVHKGLGEMQTLAIGVGDLKKVMTNVKTRGTWGEIQLGLLLEQILAPEQYDRNVATKKGSNGRVEFAIKMPGRDTMLGQPVWLPIDAKFPVENYHRLVEAQEKADPETAETEARQLEVYIKSCARDISDKYLAPPDTTDFGVMYLPTEGLFAEVARRTGLIEYIQRECRVIIAGPTTLAALLNSLQMGFRTLAIQKRSSEVWEILGAVKSEFGKFEDVLKKVEKKLQEAGNVIESVNQRSRVIHRKLRTVEELPESDAARLLAQSTPAYSGDE